MASSWDIVIIMLRVEFERMKVYGVVTAGSHVPQNAPNGTAGMPPWCVSPRVLEPEPMQICVQRAKGATNQRTGQCAVAIMLLENEARMLQRRLIPHAAGTCRKFRSEVERQ